MTKHSIITTTEARFPLAKLALSPINPRQDVSAAEVEELADSIWAVGLIQNLAGSANGKDGAEIVGGGRRLRALKLLAERHPDLAEQRPELANPPVALAPDAETAQAWAVAENAARRDLHPADEIRAYGKMERSGASPAVIARAFAVTEKHVARRLALANLPAPVIEALAANEITLNAAAAFTISGDEAQSLEVLERCRGADWSDRQIKNALKPLAVRDTDRRAVFVGLEAYRAAGGRVGGDLFAEEVLLDDPDILDTAFAEKLTERAAAYEAEGWKWVETCAESYVGYYQIEEAKMSRLYRHEGELSEEQAERFDFLTNHSGADGLAEAEQAELDAYHDILDGAFSEDQKAHSGVIVFVDNGGQLSACPGLVRREDKAAAIAAGVIEQSQHGVEQGQKSAISAKLRDDLDRVSLGARQHAALRDPDLMLDLLAFQLSHALRWDRPFGLATEEVSNWPSTEAAGLALDPRLTSGAPRDMYSEDVAKAFRAFRKKGAEHVRGELIRFLAAQYRGGDAKLAALIEKETQPQTREVWTPTAANFFGRVSGGYLSDLWRDLLALAEDDAAAVAFDKLKKAEKAAKLESLFADPMTREAHGVTADQAERITAWLPEGMV